MKRGRLKVLTRAKLVPLATLGMRGLRVGLGTGGQGPMPRGHSPEPVIVAGQEEERRSRLWWGQTGPDPVSSLQDRDVLGAGSHGTEGVGGWHPAGGLWGLRADHLPGSGHRTSPSNRPDRPLCACAAA